MTPGDGRVNENSGITTQHAVWLREHNRVEAALWQLNPHWDGERLFQETRRIINALWVQTTYGEYQPVILGRKAMDAHGLTLSTAGYWNGMPHGSIWIGLPLGENALDIHNYVHFINRLC